MSRARAVVVDDNVINLELATFLLETDGFEVVGVEHAESAIAQIAAFAPHVVLMDIQMPGVDGLVLAARLKADPATSGIAIVACTAYAMKGDEIRIRAAGCDGYISKPIDVASFAAIVRSHLKPRVS